MRWENFFGLSADMDGLTESLDDYLVAVQKVQAGLEQQDKRVQANLEAVKSMDAFRRQMNQKVLEIEKKIAKQTAKPPAKPQTLGGQSESSKLNVE